MFIAALVEIKVPTELAEDAIVPNGIRKMC